MRDNMRVKRPKLYKPFPDALAKGFKVINGPGGVALRQKVMHVPLSETPYDRMVRLHEMGHLAFTPKMVPDKQAEKHGVDVGLLQVCEDARVNTLLECKSGLPMRELGHTEDASHFYADLAKLYQKNKDAALRAAVEVRMAMTHRHDRDCDDELRAIGLGEAVEIAQRALKHLQYRPGKPLPFARTVKAVKEIQAALGERKLLEESPGDLGKHGKALGRETARGARPHSVPWGRMEVVTPKSLHEKHTKLKSAPKYFATDEGTRLRSVSRVLSDGRIFARKFPRTHLGGSLLLDGSGSMHMDPSDVVEILKIAPLAWVAIYGAHHEAGWVKILAKDGKAVAPRDCCSPGGANVIDGPALRLLAQQSGPRIWICDGIVTGVGDRQAYGNTVECAQICDEANIKRIPTVSEAITYLRTLTKPK